MATTDRPDLDTIVVRPNGNSSYGSKLHASGDDGNPLCRTVPQADHDWIEKPSAVYPPGYRSFCDRCRELIEEDDDG